MPANGSASGGRPRRRSAVRAVLRITILTFGYRCTAPVAEFCPLDDGMNLAVAAQVAEVGWAGVLTRAGERFLPVYWGTSAVTRALAGPDPRAFHAVNTTLLLVGLLAIAAWIRRRSGSWIAGTAAAVLVLASSAVGEHLATLGKNELKAVCFLGLGLLLADVFGESRSPWTKWSAGAAAVAAAFLSGAGKETGILVAVVPAAALGARWLAGRPLPDAQEWRARGRAAAALATGAVAYVVVRALVPGTESPYTAVAPSWASAGAALSLYSREAPDLWLLTLAAAVLWGACAIRRRGISPVLADAAGCLAAAFAYLAVLLWWHVHQRYYLLPPLLFLACALALAGREAWSLPAGRGRRWTLGTAGVLVAAAALFGVPTSWAVLQAQTRHDAAWAEALGTFARSPGRRLSIETETWYSEHVSGSALLLEHAYGAAGREVVGTRDLLDPSLVLPEELRLHGVAAGTLGDASRAAAAGDHLLVVAETPPAFALRGVGTAAPDVETRWARLGARVEPVDESRRGFDYRLAPRFSAHRYRIAWALYRVTAPPWVVPAPPSSWRADGWVGDVLRLRALRPLPSALWLEGRSHPDRGVRLRVRSPEHASQHEIAAGASFRIPLSGAAGLAAGDEVILGADADVAADDPDPAIRWTLERLDR
jgi:hypothetical protein